MYHKGRTWVDAALVLKQKLHFLQTQVAHKPHSNWSPDLKMAAQYHLGRVKLNSTALCMPNICLQICDIHVIKFRFYCSCHIVPDCFHRFFIFVLRKKGSKTKRRMKEEEIEKGDCGPPTRKVFFFLRFCRTWTKRYLITSQTRVKCVSRIHHRTIQLGPSGRSRQRGWRCIIGHTLFEDGPVVYPANAFDSRLRGD